MFMIGVEVHCACPRSSSNDFCGLRALREIADKKFVRGIVLHDGVSTVHFDEDLLSAPVGALWSA